MTPDRRPSAAPGRTVSASAAVIGLLLILAGCLNRAPAVTPEVAPATPQGPWFCEPAIGEDGWRCVDTPTLVANPRPSRPLAMALAEDDTRRAAGQTPQAGLSNDPAATDSAEPTMIEIGDSAMTTAVRGRPAVNEADGPADQPEAAVAMLALPPEFYVVQLAEVSSPQRLQQIFEEFGERSLSAARIQTDHTPSYVLLLGVYETFAAAELAAGAMPEAFDRFEPWIRRLGTLQAAMLRAEQQSD